MKNWIYFATSEKASLASTIETVINAQFLWRSAFNEKGARIANVGRIQNGDHVVIAWRHSGATRTAYLDCTVAEPLSPVTPGLVIDKLAGPSAQVLISAGYPQNSAGEVEGFVSTTFANATFKSKENMEATTQFINWPSRTLAICPKQLQSPLKRSLSMAIEFQRTRRELRSRRLP